jgi:hypothetical protein
MDNRVEAAACVLGIIYTPDIKVAHTICVNERNAILTSRRTKKLKKIKGNRLHQRDAKMAST